jgi:hypothetical protein
MKKFKKPELRGPLELPEMLPYPISPPLFPGCFYAKVIKYDFKWKEIVDFNPIGPDFWMEFDDQSSR